MGEQHYRAGLKPVARMQMVDRGRLVHSFRDIVGARSVLRNQRPQAVAAVHYDVVVSGGARCEDFRAPNSRQSEQQRKRQGLDEGKKACSGLTGGAVQGGHLFERMFVSRL